MPGAPDTEIMNAIQLRNRFFLAEYRIAANNYSIAQIENIFHLLSIYDLRSKGVGNRTTDHGEILKELVYMIPVLRSEIFWDEHLKILASELIWSIAE